MKKNIIIKPDENQPLMTGTPQPGFKTYLLLEGRKQK